MIENKKIFVYKDWDAETPELIGRLYILSEEEASLRRLFWFIITVFHNLLKSLCIIIHLHPHIAYISTAAAHSNILLITVENFSFLRF